MKKVIIPEVEDKCVDLCTIIADEGVHYLLYASLNEEPFGFFSRNDGGMWFFQTGSHRRGSQVSVCIKASNIRKQIKSSLSELECSTTSFSFSLDRFSPFKCIKEPQNTALLSF